MISCNGIKNKYKHLLVPKFMFRSKKTQKNKKNSFQPIINVKNFTINSNTFQKYLMLDNNECISTEKTLPEKSTIYCPPKRRNILIPQTLSRHNNFTQNPNSFFNSTGSLPSPKMRQQNKIVSSNSVKNRHCLSSNTSNFLISKHINYKETINSKESIKNVHSLLKRQIISEKRNLSSSVSTIHRNKIYDEIELKISSAKLQAPYLKLLHMSQKKGIKFHF